MNGHSVFALDVAVGDINELLNYSIFGAAAVRELHFVDLDTFALKIRRFVKLVVQPDNALYFCLEKVTHEVTRPDILSAEFVVPRSRRGKCDNLAWNYPT